MEGVAKTAKVPLWTKIIVVTCTTGAERHQMHSGIVYGLAGVAGVPERLRLKGKRFRFGFAPQPCRRMIFDKTDVKRQRKMIILRTTLAPTRPVAVSPNRWGVED